MTLIVRDSGCGMDDETRLRVFEPFFTTKGAGSGTGLGLSTCYGIVRQCNGGIEVTSEPGRGSGFSIYLPRATGAGAEVRSGHDAGRETLTGRETILLLEDDVPLRTLAHRILTSLGYTILEAANGDEALAICAAHQGAIDLVLSDVVLPGLSGPEIVRRIQNGTSGPRALFMSGYTEHPALREHRQQVAVNFIQKPFERVSLARKVREVLDAPA